MNFWTVYEFMGHPVYLRRIEKFGCFLSRGNLRAHEHKPSRKSSKFEQLFRKKKVYCQIFWEFEIFGNLSSNIIYQRTFTSNFTSGRKFSLSLLKVILGLPRPFQQRVSIFWWLFYCGFKKKATKIKRESGVALRLKLRLSLRTLSTLEHITSAFSPPIFTLRPHFLQHTHTQEQYYIIMRSLMPAVNELGGWFN